MKDETKAGKKLGITPILVRLAWSYVLKGLGRYYVEHSDYDNVVVEKLYNWRIVEGIGQGGFKVKFNRGKETLRYVEFGCRLVGGGGEEIIKLATLEI